MNDFEPAHQSFRFDHRGFSYSLVVTGLLFAAAAFGGRVAEDSIALSVPPMPFVSMQEVGDATVGYVTGTLAAVGSVFQQNAEAETTVAGLEQDMQIVSDVQVRDIPLPDVTAQAFLIGDARTGKVFASERLDTPYPIASVTKYMTALVAQDVFNPDTEIIVPRDPTLTASDYRIVKEGDVYSAGNAVYPLLMHSSNAVAHAFARQYGTSQFHDRMNQTAALLGMHATQFADASGLSAQNVSTAEDLHRLMQHLYRSAPDLLAASAEPYDKKLLTGAGELREFPNRNVFMGEPGFVGGKIGYIRESRQTYTAIFEVPVDGGIVPVAIVVLRSQEREDDTRALLEWFKQAVVTE